MAANDSGALSPADSDPVALKDLLELENHQAFVELACPTTGILAWPAIRNEAIRMLLGDRLGYTGSVASVRRRLPAGHVLRAAGRAIIHNRRHPAERSDVLIVASGAGLTPFGGTLRNRYADPFADVLGERAWTVEGLFDLPDAATPRSNARLGLLAADRLAASLRMRLVASRRVRSVASALVELVVDRGRAQLDWLLDRDRRAILERLATRRLAAYPLRARQAEGLLRRVSPRLALVEDASFGYMAVFNAVARSRGIHLAEYQHGMITPGHDGYNVHPTLGASEAYRRTLPDHLLTFGDWWTGQLNLPVTRVPIGSPHRSQVLEGWAPNQRRDAVLVLGDGIETDASLGLCRSLASVTPHRVVFRPHPLERARLDGLGDEPFAIDPEPDLYRSFANAAIVIAEYSTALFEAVGLVPRVVAWDTPRSRFYLGAHPFERLARPEDVAAANASPIQPDLAAAMWASGWRERFERYVEQTTPRA